jgi:hypothetical protein
MLIPTPAQKLDTEVYSQSPACFSFFLAILREVFGKAKHNIG